MTPENFCYWLQGYFEIGECDKNKGSEALSMQQVAEIRKHLGYVFKAQHLIANPPIVFKDGVPEYLQQQNPPNPLTVTC